MRVTTFSISVSVALFCDVALACSSATDIREPNAPAAFRPEPPPPLSPLPAVSQSLSRAASRRSQAPFADHDSIILDDARILALERIGGAFFSADDVLHETNEKENNPDERAAPRPSAPTASAAPVKTSLSGAPAAPAKTSLPRAPAAPAKTSLPAPAAAAGPSHSSSAPHTMPAGTLGHITPDEVIRAFQNATVEQLAELGAKLCPSPPHFTEQDILFTKHVGLGLEMPDPHHTPLTWFVRSSTNEKGECIFHTAVKAKPDHSVAFFGEVVFKSVGGRPLNRRLAANIEIPAGGRWQEFPTVTTPCTARDVVELTITTSKPPAYIIQQYYH